MVDSTPSYLQPFVLKTEALSPQRAENIQLYLPPSRLPSPLVVLVHGGPMRTPPIKPASQWPVFQGYASALTAQGVAAAMFDHGFLTGDEEAAPEHLRAAIETARGHERIEAQRVVLWFFSGGGVLATPYLSHPPTWLRGMAFSYAVLDDEDPSWDPREGLRHGLELPLLLTRVEDELPGLIEGQAQFVALARDIEVPLDVIDVAGASHAFDSDEPTGKGVAAVRRAVEWVVKTI